MFWTIFLLITGIKLLLMPSYRSTDFEVHRNWLAITHSLPLSKWYFEDTSEWTLDYPPLFAYFEYALSQVAQFFDKQMLNVSNLGYASNETILFQRLSVIVTDIVYAIGAKRCIQHLTDKSLEQTFLAVTLLGNFGLLIIDHIHFQYNGIMFGILLISISKILEEKFLQSAFYFAVLLNMKHIFIYISPVFIVYLFKFYCCRSATIQRAFVNLLKLGAIVIGVTVISFGPFYDHIPQVLSRLFPFKRGLCHAYWAPNFWALYNIADKVAAKLTNIPFNPNAANTGGLVQEFEHQVLPSIRPAVTFILTLCAMLPCLVKMFTLKYDRKKTPLDFVRAVAICGCTSYMFGWHVHEKAILMVFIPLSLLTFTQHSDASHSLFLSIVANYSLFPLLFTPELVLIKLSLFLLYNALIVFGLFSAFKSKNLTELLPLHELLYILGFIPLFCFDAFLQHLLNLDKRLPFLPLLLTSVYCSIGIVYFWLKYYCQFLFSSFTEKPIKISKTQSNSITQSNSKKKKKQKAN